MNGSISRRGLSLGLLASACALGLGAAAVPASATARPFTMFRSPADLKRSSGAAAASRVPLDHYLPPDPDDDYEPGVPYDFQILQLEADTVVGTGDGDYGGRLHIQFARDNGYLLIAPPLGAGGFRARIEIETNAAVVVIIGNDFVPQGHKIHDPYYPPSKPWIVKDMLQIFFQGRTSSRNPACYILRCRTTSFENGNPYYEAGGPLEVSGDEDDPAEWPLLYVDNSWFDAWYGWFGSNSGHTQGHMNWIKGVPGTLGGLRVAGCRVKTNYLFVLGNDWGMEEHGPINEAWATFEIRDTQFVRAQHPADYDGGTIYNNTIYHHTSYDPATLSGGYHPFVYVGGPSGGPDGFGFWVDIGEQPAFTHIGDMVQPPVGYGVAIDGPNLVSDGKPPVSSRRSADNLPLVVGTIWAGTHPKTGDLTERCRPVMRHEAGAAYAVRTKAELKAYIELNRTGFPGGPDFWKDGVHDEQDDEIEGVFCGAA